ncbi:MAG TPA: hypothetical protein ENH29_06320 [Bacteroidetes bacterium]|nr:hypothetical protein [Bacteroidota bacterium]
MGKLSGDKMAGKKREYRYYLVIVLSVFVIFVGLAFYFHHWQKTHKTGDRVIIRIFPQSDDQVAKLRRMKFIKKEQVVADFVEVSGRFRDVLTLNNAGIPSVIVIESEQQETVDPVYPGYAQILAEIDSLKAAHSDIVRVEEIGRSQHQKRPIIAVQISEYGAGKNRIKPAVLFMAGQHAREPVGIQVCLGIVRRLVTHQAEPEVANWLTNLSVWVVPCLNPDGYDYVIANHLKFPWWRKNLHDNNQNSIFEPDSDGVDLNRNYNFNWSDGGSDQPETWYYRGTAPVSESETRALVNLANRERFVLAVDYHSFGESVLFPWANEMKPPDAELIRDVAAHLADRLERNRKGKKYRTIPLNGKSGQSANWLYAKFRTLAFIVETGDEYFPSFREIAGLVESQWQGVTYLLNRTLQAGVSGFVRNKNRGTGVDAILQAEFDFSPVVAPGRTDAKTGFFYRLLLPGKYTFQVSAAGYREKTIASVIVPAERNKKLSITLARLPGNE